MSDYWTSRPTFTHGRSDRAVKRTVGVSEGGFSNGMSMARRKRPIGYIGGDLDDRDQHYIKRQHGESHGTSNLNDMHLEKDDLRFKLMQKNKVRRSQNNDSWSNVDLRYKLSGASQFSVRDTVMHPDEATVCTQYVDSEPRDIGLTRKPMFESKDTAVLARVPSLRNTSDQSMLNPGRNYPSWTVGDLRRRAPGKVLLPAATRALSLERNTEERQRSLVRAYGDERSSAYLRISPTRPISSSAFLTRSSIAARPVSSIGALPAHYPQGSRIMQKIPSMGVEHLTVESLLRSLGLEKYTIHFKAEEIDMNALRQLGDNDLKELGIPMGPRKKILQAIMSRLRRHP